MFKISTSNQNANFYYFPTPPLSPVSRVEIAFKRQKRKNSKTELEYLDVHINIRKKNIIHIIMTVCVLVTVGSCPSYSSSTPQHDNSLSNQCFICQR